ncbi:hypothetical protein CKAN_01507500 [Cinnamomum micranthum f. kanehirae]|uniref:Uncharacterized protein n=1 Tax=Cinnamomum micranthum f. kanehirae TaxID=337451 RepID=A0A3S3QJR4_9MAGN|nr:hypothetical protein CKAN_01507500 [Cinnamomum micranthum f. kanehirae]
MYTLVKTIDTPFPIKYHQIFQARKLLRRKRATISCKSEESQPSSPSEGDTRRQEILAKMAMLQAQKVRLTDFLDEKSAYLTQFAKDANSEFDQIGETALKGLDEAEARRLGKQREDVYERDIQQQEEGKELNRGTPKHLVISDVSISMEWVTHYFDESFLRTEEDSILENIDNRMQAFEEDAESNRNNIEKNEQKLAEFEDKMEVDQNEGLFFKNLTMQQQQKKPPSYAAKEEMQKLRQVERENAGSKARRSIYLALICLLALTILNALITSPAGDWRKIAGLGVILVALIAQLAYEQSMSSAEPEKTGEEDGRREDEQ